LQEILVEYGENGVDITKDTYFTDFMVSWLENLRHSIAPTTYDSYQVVLDAHILPYFGKKKLRVRDMTPAVIQKYVNDKLKTLSANSVRKHLANISKCLDSAVKQNIIAFNPAKRIELPKKERYTGAKHYNERQIEQLLEASKGDPLEMVILLTLFYGLRRSEIIGLKWDSVDFHNDTITIEHTVTTCIVDGKQVEIAQDTTKTKSSHRTLPLVPFFKEKLQALREEQEENRRLCGRSYFKEFLDYVCVDEMGDRIKANYVTTRFPIVLKQNKMQRIRFHDLRHSCASLMLANGVSMKQIQEWLGHSDFSTTANVYAHLDYSSKVSSALAISESLKL
jgi:integrase